MCIRDSFTGSISRAVEDEPTTEEDVTHFIKKHLWEMLTNSCKKGQYQFINDDNGEYHFVLCDRFGEQIGSSHEYDFNNRLGTEITNLSSQEITIHSPDLPAPQNFEVAAATVEKDTITISLTTAPTQTLTNVQLSFTEKFNFDLSSVDPTLRSFKINTLIDNDNLLAGDTIEIIHVDPVSGIISSEGEFTILKIEEESGQSKFSVQQPFPPLNANHKVIYTKTFEVKGIAGSDVIIFGKEEVKARDQFIEWIKTKFFTQEGMHLIEHTLLRPKYCAWEKHNDLVKPKDFGDLIYPIRLPLILLSLIHI